MRSAVDESAGVGARSPVARAAFDGFAVGADQDVEVSECFYRESAGCLEGLGDGGVIPAHGAVAGIEDRLAERASEYACVERERFLRCDALVAGSAEG